MTSQNVESIEQIMEKICWDIMTPIERKDISIDPIKYEIAVHRIGAMLREGSYSLVRTSGSPIVTEVGEYMFAIYDADGHSAYVTAGVLPHLTGTEGGIKFIKAMFQGDISPEDQFILNDPYLLGIHTPDVLIAKPVFYKDELLCWVGSLTHCVEIGAKDPGGTSDSTDVFQEGVRLPGFKIIDKGERVEEVFRLMKRNVRTPELMELDMRSKIAGNNVVYNRLEELISKEGASFLKDLLQKMIQETEDRAKAKVEMIPDGVWKNRAYGDHNGIDWQPIWCDMVATKSGNTIHLDLSGSSLQEIGPVNAPLAGSIGAIFSVLVSTIFWELIWNRGVVTPLNITIPKGCLFNPQYPASTFADAPTTLPLLAGTLTKIISEMCLAAGLRDVVCAPWNSSHGGVFMGGQTQFGELEGTVTFDANSGGTGATLRADGDDTAAFLLAPGAMMADVESYESKYPLLYLFRRKRQNSGGYGKFQGGLAHESAVMIHGTKNWKVGFRSIGRKVACTSGILGGYPANSHLHGFLFRSATSGARMSGSQLNQLLRIEDIVEMPGVKIVPPMCPVTLLAEGDVYFQCLSGGGGCGDPLLRDPNMVLSDVIDGKISNEVAFQVYGVLIKGEEIDSEATAEQRASILNQRRKSNVPRAQGSRGDSGGITDQFIGTNREKAICLKCGVELLEMIPTAGRKASDVKHVWVDEEWMYYREYYCPKCWSLIRIDPICIKE